MITSAASRGCIYSLFLCRVGLLSRHSTCLHVHMYVHLHCVSKKRPTFTTCYNFYIHSLIATIFGTNVAKKAGNQNLLYFPTTPN